MSHRRSVVFRTLLSALLLLLHVSTASAQVGWTPPVTIAGISQTGGTILAPKVAVDPAGNAVAVFTEPEGSTSRRVMAVRFDQASNRWSAPQQLSLGCALAPCEVEIPSVAVDGSGNAVAVWVSRLGTGTNLLQSRRYLAASDTWGAVETLSSGGPSATSAVLAMNAAGDAVLFWLQQAGPPSGMLVRRLSGIGGTWSAPLQLTPTWSQTNAAAIDAAGNAHALWVDGAAIKGSRFDVGTATWGAAVTVADGLPLPAAPGTRLAANAAGDAVATWTRGTTVEASRYPAGAGAWTSPVALSTGGSANVGARGVVDTAGNVTVAWVQTAAPNQVLLVRRYTVSSGTWSMPEQLGETFAYPPPGMAVDAAGNVFVVWSQSLASPGIRLLGARYAAATTQWRVTRNLSEISQSAFNADVDVDAAGNAVAVWFQSASGFGVTQAIRWSALAGTPRITGVTPASGGLAVAVDPEDSGATTYDYSLDGGTTWTSRTPAGTSSPLVVSGLTNGVMIPLRVRAVNAVGAGAPTPVVPVRAGTDANPSAFRIVAKSGSTVTFAWTAPAAGIAPTGYLLEGGIVPLSTLASVPTGGSATTATFTLPVGSFSARIVALYGARRLGTSNELAFSVGGPQLPAAPTGLVGSAVGTALTLSWTNRFELGTPTGVRLDVSGGLSASLPLALGESFSFPNVPAGTYTFTVSATNAAGASAPSSPVTLTFPGVGTCATPQAPTAYSAGVTGTLVALAWAPPAAGPPVTGYVLQVTGAFTGTLPVAARTLSIPAPAGSYSIAVAATNACGTGAFTAAQAVVVP